MVIDEGFEQIMTNNIPVLRTLARYFDAGVDIAGLDEMLEDATGRQDPYEGMEDLLQNIATLGGLKFKEIDEDYQRERMQRDIEEAAAKVRPGSNLSRNIILCCNHRILCWILGWNRSFFG